MPGRKPLPHSIPTALPQVGTPYSTSNRKSQVTQITRVYPWLLMASTLVAGFFCYLYLTKPVLLPAPEPIVLYPGSVSSGGSPTAGAGEKSLTGPALDRLPGDAPGAGKPALVDPRSSAFKKNGLQSAYEETNLRVQHVLTAEAPGGELNQITLNVPVLYRSRNLLWSQQDVSKARDLLIRLSDYQERTRSLRAEGVSLLDAWNHLIDRSIPASGLRADSPSLTGNQMEPSANPRPSALDTSEAVRIQTSGK